MQHIYKKGDKFIVAYHAKNLRVRKAFPTLLEAKSFRDLCEDMANKVDILSTLPRYPLEFPSNLYLALGENVSRIPNEVPIPNPVMLRYAHYKTFSEIGNILGVSRQRAQQIVSTQVAKLRKDILKYEEEKN